MVAAKRSSTAADTATTDPKSKRTKPVASSIDLAECSSVVKELLLRASSSSNAAAATGADANRAFEACCSLVSANPTEAEPWLLLSQVIAHCKNRFELRVSKQAETGVLAGLGGLFSSSSSSESVEDATAAEEACSGAWRALHTDVDFHLSQEQLFGLLVTRTQLRTPQFMLAVLLKTCQNSASPRKLFEYVVGNEELFALLLTLAATTNSTNVTSVAWDVLYCCLFEHDGDDDIAKACPRAAAAAPASSSSKKATNQNNWKQVFWPKLFALQDAAKLLPTTTGWGTVLCKMHRKRHGESAATTTAIWFELLYHASSSSSAAALAEIGSLLEHGPLFYSPTSETDVTALKLFTEEYVVAAQGKHQVDVVVIKHLLLVDHRCVEPHFVDLLDRFPTSSELVLCLAEAFAKTRRVPAWIALMGKRGSGFHFATLAQQTDFRMQFALMLRAHLLEHQLPLIWRAFQEYYGQEQKQDSEAVACALEAYVLVLPCQPDAVVQMDKILKQQHQATHPSDCLQHSRIRVRETWRKYKALLGVVGEEEEDEPAAASPALQQYIDQTANEQPTRARFALLSSKDECVDMWRRIAAGAFPQVLKLAWFYELERMQHYFVKFFLASSSALLPVLLELVARFPVGYLSAKHLGKIARYALDNNNNQDVSSSLNDLIAKVLLLPLGPALDSKLFATCEEFVQFACRLKHATDAEELIKRFPVDEAALDVLQRASPSYLFAATHVKWEPAWIDAFLAKHASTAAASSPTLWTLASCLNLVKQQQSAFAAGNSSSSDGDDDDDDDNNKKKTKSKAAKFQLDIGCGFRLAVGRLAEPDTKAFVLALSETVHLATDTELVQQKLTPMLFALCLELLATHDWAVPFHRALEKAATQQVAVLLDLLQAYAWSADDGKQRMACRALCTLFEFGVRGNYETIVKRRTRSLLVALARLAQVTDGDEAWRALCALCSTRSGDHQQLDISSRDLVVMLTATAQCQHVGKTKFLQIMLELFPACVTGDATAAFVSAVSHAERDAVYGGGAGQLVEYIKVCEKLEALAKTFRHHAVALLCDHVEVMMRLHSENGGRGGGGAQDRLLERAGFHLLDLCGEYELNQLNAALGGGGEAGSALTERLASERRHYVKTLVDSHSKRHVFKGKI